MNFSNVTKTATSGSFWGDVLWTGVGVLGGELATRLANNVMPSAGGLINDIAGGVVTGAVGITMGKPQVAVGTVATKALKQVNQI